MEKVIEKIKDKDIKKHLENMENNYKDEINYSFKNTKIYENCIEIPELKKRFEDTNVFIYSHNIVNEFRAHSKNLDSNTAIVNIGSFRNPCGMIKSTDLFTLNSTEELLCKESNLANILYLFKDTFYQYNEHNEYFKGLYSSRSLFIPDVVINGKEPSKVNIISISAPDCSLFKRANIIVNQYNRDTKNLNTLYLRIAKMFNIAYENNIDTLFITGFGCEENYQKPEVVAQVFNTYLKGRYKNVFKNIYFCIDREKYKNVFEEFVNRLGQISTVK